jgi:hypothetical protein
MRRVSVRGSRKSLRGHRAMAMAAAGLAALLAAGCCCLWSESEPPSVSGGKHEGKQEGKGPWYLHNTGHMVDLAYDPARNCLWLAGDEKLGQFDLKTLGHRIAADGAQQGGMGAKSVAVEGDHVWVGGHKMRGDGGLWMYDIPTGALMVYREQTTQRGNVKGLQSNTVHHIVAEPGVLYLYSDNPFDRWGITRYIYGAKDPASQWTTFSGRHVGNPKELMYNSVSGMLKDANGKYLLMMERAHFQEFDPQTGQVKTLDVISQDPKLAVTGVAPNGRKITMWASVTEPHDKLFAIEGSRVWFTATLCNNELDKFTALVCHDRSDGSFLVFSNALTESRPKAADGLASVPTCMCFDGDDIWMGTSGIVLMVKPFITRYNRKTREFTRYMADADGVPRVQDFWACAATPDAVYFATDQGVLRYVKSKDYPKATGGFVTQAGKEVAVEGEAAVTFDMPMNGGTINKDNVELLVNGAVYNATVTYDAGRNAAVVNVGGRLPAGMRCELVLKSTVQAANGNPLRWTRIPFTTKAM